MGGVRVIRFLRGLLDVDAAAIGDGETLVWDAGTGKFVPGAGGGGGAPTTADYLVGTAQAGLSAEIVVGAAPGGELGGSWASPTVDATHSGSSHAGTQAAAEATAAAALAGHDADTTNVHGIVDTSVLATDAELAAMLDQAVILAPAASARNVIQPTLGSVIAEIIRAHASQSVDVWNVQKSDGGKYLRVGATGAVGIGNGTYDPAAYGGYLTQVVLSRASDGYYDSGGGPPFTPSTNTGVVQKFLDAELAPSVDLTVASYQTGMSFRGTGLNDFGVMTGTFIEAIHFGTKASGAGSQGSLNGFLATAYSDPSATGDLALLRGGSAVGFHEGSGVLGSIEGHIAGADVYSTASVTGSVIADLVRASVQVATGTAVPVLTGVKVEAYSTGRAVTVAKGLDVLNVGQHANVVTSYGLYMAAQSGATNVFGLYIAGGKSVFVDSLLTGKIALPADADFANGQGGWWWDQANSLPKWKGKTSGGVVVNFVPADATGLADHIADASDAHDASAVSFSPTGTIAATDVQAAIAEVASEAAGGGISATIVDAKGDLIAATAADTVARLAVGSNDQVLTADSAQTTGLKWAAAGGGFPTTDLRTATASKQLPLDVFGGGLVIASGNFNTGANTADFTLIVINKTITINRILWKCTNATGNVDVGIYDDDGTSGAPGTRLVSSGSFAPSVGNLSTTVASTTLTPGIYWCAVAADNGTFALAGITRNLLQALATIRYTKGTSFPLPSSIASPSSSASTDGALMTPAVA